MIKINFTEHTGVVRSVPAKSGNTLMQTAAINAIPGIEADCGGACSCATCHVFIDPAWMEIVGETNPTENAMLSLVAERADNSRLSCQVVLTEAMDGLTVTTPATQY
jgi:2Fe-2S ferredoxin